jgi:flagellar basal body-associated protein FliL
MEKEEIMDQKYKKSWTVIVGALVVLILAIVIVPRLMSNDVAGTVTAVDSTGMATVKTEDGLEHKMQSSGWQVGDMVECDTQEGQVTCKKS